MMFKSSEVGRWVVAYSKYGALPVLATTQCVSFVGDTKGCISTSIYPIPTQLCSSRTIGICRQRIRLKEVGGEVGSSFRCLIWYVMDIAISSLFRLARGKMWRISTNTGPIRLSLHIM
jgi:hypothetical protein